MFKIENIDLNSSCVLKRMLSGYTKETLGTYCSYKLSKCISLFELITGSKLILRTQYQNRVLQQNTIVIVNDVQTDTSVLFM